MGKKYPPLLNRDLEYYLMIYMGDGFLTLQIWLFKEGAFVKRDPSVDPDTNLNVPALLNGSMLLALIILVCSGLIYLRIIRKHP